MAWHSRLVSPPIMKYTSPGPENNMFWIYPKGGGDRSEVCLPFCERIFSCEALRIKPCAKKLLRAHDVRNRTIFRNMRCSLVTHLSCSVLSLINSRLEQFPTIPPLVWDLRSLCLPLTDSEQLKLKFVHSSYTLGVHVQPCA